MKLPILYKSGNRGTEQWQVEVIDHMQESEILVTWNMVNGAIQTKSTLIHEGKNIGKANETTFMEQARLQAKSMWQKKIDRNGYIQDLNMVSIAKANRISPMLAKIYADHKHKLIYPTYVQPKLDGSRALTYLDMISEVVMVSRQGKKFETTQHIKDELKVIFEKFPDLVLDGELYQHGETFQNIISKIKRDEANDKSIEVKYHIYDCFFPNNPNQKFSDRHKILLEVFKNKFKYVEKVNTIICGNEETIFTYYNDCIHCGYEGSIVRGDAEYKIGGRSDQLLKLKEFTDGEFEIIDFEKDKNDHVVFICKTNDGKSFKVKPEGNDEQRKKYLADAKKLIGKMLTVKYFELTDDGIPRFPTGKAIYNDCLS